MDWCFHSKTDPEEVAGLFRDKFKTLYNSVGYDEKEIDCFYRNNESRIESHCARDLCD